MYECVIQAASSYAVDTATATTCFSFLFLIEVQISLGNVLSLPYTVVEIRKTYIREITHSNDFGFCFSGAQERTQLYGQASYALQHCVTSLAIIIFEILSG